MRPANLSFLLPRFQRAALLPWVVGLCLTAPSAGALTVKDYHSPRNHERPARKATRYIILHTTEGPTKGSLNKVRDNGEAHYVVDPGGIAYRIIDKGRVAYHAGRSMWNGQRNVDEVSVGIEIVGYHDRALTSSQYTAVRDLLDQLQRIYSVPDSRVLPHSMVAYGAPNRWHRRSHRGRKRCAMLLARSSVRRKLGLYEQPLYDPDVKAGRLVVADSYLSKVLYQDALQSTQAQGAGTIVRDNDMTIGNGRSAWDVAREHYNSPTTRYVFPNGTVRQGNEIRDWKKIPPGTRVVMNNGEGIETQSERVREIGVDGSSAADIAGDEIGSSNTIYFLPDGMVRTGKDLGAAGVGRLPKHTRVLVGYKMGGYISRYRSAYDVCGERWKAPSTLYHFPDGTIRPGNTVDEGAIPKGTQVFFRN